VDLPLPRQAPRHRLRRPRRLAHRLAARPRAPKMAPMTMGRTVGAGLVVALALTASGGDDPPAAPRGRPSASEARSTAPAITDAERAQFEHDRAEFAAKLYGEAAAASEGNLIFSPHSISLAMGLTWGGARGQTAAELADAMVFSQGAKVHDALDD